MYDHEMDPIQANPENSGVDLAVLLARTLADTVVAANIAQGYHWNVLGPDFSAEVYEDFDGSVDPTAELILTLGHEAPYLLTDFLELTCIQEERIAGLETAAMFQSLHRINGILIGQFDRVFAMASEINRQDIADFAASRLAALHKQAWMFKATLGIR
jgi:starvation-inducible DNA-binding protein